VFSREQIDRLHESSFSLPQAQREAYFRRIIVLLGEGNRAFTNYELMAAIAKAQKEARSGKTLTVSAA
jgi:hypothetical protein